MKKTQKSKPYKTHDSLGRKLKPPRTKNEWLAAIEHSKMSCTGKPYLYDQVGPYVASTDRITFTCPDHGSFEVTAHSHLKHGCRMCAAVGKNAGRPSHRKLSLRELVAKAKAIHADLDYSKAKGDKLTDTWNLVCPKHGPFTQKVQRLIYDRSRGCPECQTEKRRKVHSAKSEAGKEACIKACAQLGYKLLKYSTAHSPVVAKCPTHGKFTIEKAYYLTQHQSICPACRPSSSAAEQLLRKALEDSGLRVDMHRRDLIKDRELDLFLPRYKVAIEVNGVWHHRPEQKDKFYHKYKTEQCEALGITLLHITDLDIKKRLPLIVSMVRAKCGLFERRYGARQLIVREVSYKRASAFLEQHHMQGSIAGHSYLGLYLYLPKRRKYRLVALSVIGRPRFARNYDWELLRFATRQGYQVMGGLSRLLSAFRDAYDAHGQTLVSYASRAYSKGGAYEATGFTKVRCTVPNYVWHNGSTSYSRYQTQKHRLQNLLDDYDDSLSEAENLTAHGFWPLYDSGNLVYERTL